VFADGVDVHDVQQRGLGTCYFLSALTVLSNEDVRDKFIFEEETEEWKTCGAFCIKFYDGFEEDIIIIDEYLVTDGGNSKFAFCNSKNGDELWPTILEKAYAKKFGSYSIIWGGHIDRALDDLVGGIPEVIDLRGSNDTANLQKIWDKVYQEHKDIGSYLGAGSVSHKDGDKA